jgi:hypothetical protein
VCNNSVIDVCLPARRMRPGTGNAYTGSESPKMETFTIIALQIAFISQFVKFESPLFTHLHCIILTSAAASG